MIRVSAAVVVLASTLLAGCAGESSARAQPDATAFSAAGRWAPDFAEGFAEGTDYQARILADGVITAAELSDAQSRVSSCMEDSGYRYTSDDDGGAEAAPLPGHSAEPAETVNALMATCSRRFDSAVTWLSNEVRRNPDKLDEAEIAVACLREAGLVDPSYTERRWRAEHDAGKFPFDDWDASAVQCRLDPLGLWRTP